MELANTAQQAGIVSANPTRSSATKHKEDMQSMRLSLRKTFYRFLSISALRRPLPSPSLSDSLAHVNHKSTSQCWGDGSGLGGWKWSGKRRDPSREGPGCEG